MPNAITEKGRTEMNAKKNKPRATDGAGNVFADLGLPNPEKELVKASLPLRIHRIIRQRGLTPKEAAALLGVKQPQVSLLMRDRSGNFSMGHLIEFLTALAQDVQITVHPTRK